MSKEVILTGIRSNEEPTLGNYLGAFVPMVQLQQHYAGHYQLNMFVPDLHSFTTPIDHTTLYENTLTNLKYFIAAGLDITDEHTFLYRQSFIPAHSELTWILDCFTGFGEMSRMTQFKEKSADTNNNVTVGLFNYPVLMAADILLYNARWVPVGEDQFQHLEITRDIAERMNHKFGELFTVPEPVAKQHQFFGKDQGLRIKDLQNPTKKMSKSDETGKGVIFLSDTPDAARKKIMSAATDSLGRVHYDKDAQPGISNLLEILTLVRQANGRVVSLRQTVDEFTGLERYGEFKKIVADEMAEFLADFQARLAQVDNDVILRKLKSSEITASQTASQTLLRVQKAVGLRR